MTKFKFNYIPYLTHFDDLIKGMLLATDDNSYVLLITSDPYYEGDTVSFQAKTLANPNADQVGQYNDYMYSVEEYMTSPLATAYITRYSEEEQNIMYLVDEVDAATTSMVYELLYYYWEDNSVMDYDHFAYLINQGIITKDQIVEWFSTYLTECLENNFNIN